MAVGIRPCHVHRVYKTHRVHCPLRDRHLQRVINGTAYRRQEFGLSEGWNVATEGKAWIRRSAPGVERIQAVQGEVMNGGSYADSFYAGARDDSRVDRVHAA